MATLNMERITRTMRLTPEEISNDRKVRELVEQEKPEMKAQIRQRMADVRLATAARNGTPTLGQRIRAVRETRELSQVALAASAGISQGYLSQLEQDEREPTLSIAARIAHALQLSLDDLAANIGS